MQRFLTKSILAGCLLASFASAQVNRAVFLLDRSGSMLSGGTPNRCDRSHAACLNDITNYFIAHPAGLAMVRELSGDIPGGVRSLGATAWHTTAGSARAAANTAMPCGGLTPLAAGICDTGNAVFLAAGSGASTTRVCYYVYSDGGQNLPVGACTGLEATNANMGSCSFDTFGSGIDYAAGSDGNPSWQGQACDSLALVNTFFMSMIMSTYKFDHFATDGGFNSGFSFLDSASRGLGGVSIEVDDSVSVVPQIQLTPTSCDGPNSAAPVLQFQGQPLIGETFTSIMLAAPGYSRYLSLSGTGFSQPIDLSVLQAPGCALGLDPQFAVQSPLLPFPIPNNPQLIGQQFFLQGLAFDINLGLNPGWLLTTHTFEWEIQADLNLPPTVTITNPSMNLLGQNGLVWTGFDQTRGQWFRDVTLQANATDDDPIPSGNIVWTTNRTDLQGSVLGTGSSISTRFYGNNATNEIHTITVTVTDQNGATASDQVQIRFWTLI